MDGIAAGDVVHLLGSNGHYEVVERAGNVSVKRWSSAGPSFDTALAELTKRLALIGGWLDGSIPGAAVWTVPVSAGFGNIESIFSEVVEGDDELAWHYGNVYDADNKPLAGGRTEREPPTMDPIPEEPRPAG